MKMMREVVRSNSLNALFMTNMGISYEYLHKYDSAIIFHEKAIRLMPKWGDAYLNKIESLIARDGNTVAAEALQDTAEQVIKTTYLRRNRILFDLYNGKYEDALTKATLASPDEYFSNGERFMVFAEIYRYLKNKDLSRDYFKSAYDYFNRILEEDPDIPDIISYMGIAAAGLDDRVKAVELGQKAIDLSTGNVQDFKDRILDLAKIYVMTGEYDKCVSLLRELFKTPFYVSYRILLLDPVWKPLRNLPEFKEMISYYSINNQFN
jgi:tetratricopeptide (TPR) repeat protein